MNALHFDWTPLYPEEQYSNQDVRAFDNVGDVWAYSRGNCQIIYVVAGHYTSFGISRGAHIVLASNVWKKGQVQNFVSVSTRLLMSLPTRAVPVGWEKYVQGKIMPF